MTHSKALSIVARVRAEYTDPEKQDVLDRLAIELIADYPSNDCRAWEKDRYNRLCNPERVPA